MFKKKIFRLINKDKYVYFYGYSLIEIMIVILLMGLLAGGASVYLIGRLRDNKIKIARSQAFEISKVLEIYKLRFNKYPYDLENLVNPGGSVTPYLEEKPRDPWGNYYFYRNPGIKNQRKPDVYSLGPDEEGGEEIGNWMEKLEEE